MEDIEQAEADLGTVTDDGTHTAVGVPGAQPELGEILEVDMTMARVVDERTGQAVTAAAARLVDPLIDVARAIAVEFSATDLHGSLADVRHHGRHAQQRGTGDPVAIDHDAV